MNGRTPRKMVENVTSCTTLLITNTFMPTGGWISPSSTVMTMMTPNQIGLASDKRPRITAAKRQGRFEHSGKSGHISLPEVFDTTVDEAVARSRRTKPLKPQAVLAALGRYLSTINLCSKPRRKLSTIPSSSLSYHPQ
jgi:hypothetical protein